MMRKTGERAAALVLMGLAVALAMTGYGRAIDGKRVVCVSLGQSEVHPQYIGLVMFKNYVEGRLGGKLEMQISPNEVLGSAQKAVKLTQTGAIDFVVVGTANPETSADVYEAFSISHLFDSRESYLEAMQDADYMERIYEPTDGTGFRVSTWYNAGTRNFYAEKSTRTSGDLKGLRIRVRQSPASVKMVQAFGVAAFPMSLGEVYTAIQQDVIDGTENNELAPTSNKHGGAAKYFTYNMHQMVPDMPVGNLKFLNSLSPEELQIFKEATALSTEMELGEQDKQVEEMEAMAGDGMGVEFIGVDVAPFKEKVFPLHEEMFRNSPVIVGVYDYAQATNQHVKEGR